jgi:uncharacterized protein (UPF0332 family)
LSLPSPDRLSRSHRELAAARLLAEEGFPSQAVSRAYYAAFFAAEQALLTLEETRTKHSGVIAAFNKLLVREHGLDESCARTLRRLFERRSDADYGGIEVTSDQASAAIEDGERFVQDVGRWLAAQNR